jgi:hypothetical protein
VRAIIVLPFFKTASHSAESFVFFIFEIPVINQIVHSCVHYSDGFVDFIFWIHVFSPLLEAVDELLFKKEERKAVDCGIHAHDYYVVCATIPQISSGQSALTEST